MRIWNFVTVIIKSIVIGSNFSTLNYYFRVECVINFSLKVERYDKRLLQKGHFSNYDHFFSLYYKLEEFYFQKIRIFFFFFCWKQKNIAKKEWSICVQGTFNTKYYSWNTYIRSWKKDCVLKHHKNQNKLPFC